MQRSALSRLVVHAASVSLLACIALAESGPGEAVVGPLRDLDSHCPFEPPATADAWARRADTLRDQVRVSLGLWPMPALAPLAADVRGRITLDGYAVEKVTFESLPGLVVTGNLYRPDPLPPGRKVPAVLCPHGHWPNGRFQDVPAKEVAEALANGGERFEAAARNPIQARCVQLARMGCVVFQWDMLGYCDSTQISLERVHRFATQDPATEVTPDGWLLFSPLAEAHCQSVMGLQALIALRSVDFVLSLPEVYAKAVNGDGFLFYPDPSKKHDPCPSMRAALMRDGFEDYELFSLARSAAQALVSAGPTLPPAKQATAGKWLASARQILDVEDTIPATNRFSEDAATYENRHRRLLRLLETLDEDVAP